MWRCCCSYSSFSCSRCRCHRRTNACLVFLLALFQAYSHCHCVCAQAYKSYGVPEKRDRFPLFLAMGVGSVVALGMMKVFKPKKKKA